MYGSSDGRRGAEKLAAFTPEPFQSDLESVATNRRGGNAPGRGGPARGSTAARPGSELIVLFKIILNCLYYGCIDRICVW